MLKKYWIKCPICNGKTRVQVFHNTVLKDFPLFCPKCKLTHIIDVEKLEIVNVNQYDVMGICGNGASYSVLMEAGVENADLVIAVTNSDCSRVV